MQSVKVELNTKGNKRGMHPNSRKNLTRQGCGRPRNELSLTNLAREKLKEPCPYSPDKTWLEYLVERWLGQAVESSTYFNQLIERLEGKVVQPVEGKLEHDISFTIGRGYDGFSPN